MQTSGLSGISRLVDTLDSPLPNDGSGRVGISATARAANTARHRPQQVDAALYRRLSQLRTALGEAETTPAEAALAHATGPAASAGSSGQDLSRSLTLLSTAVVSAMVGAATAWTVATSGASSAGPQTAEQRPASSVAAAELIVNESSPPTAHPSPTPSDEEQLADQLEAWRLAWSTRDVEAYLAHYSEGFIPSGGITRPTWASARRANIAGRSSISVQLREVNPERIDKDRVRLSFLQDYAAGNYRDDGQPKMLELTREGTVWRIVLERQLKG